MTENHSTESTTVDHLCDLADALAPGDDYMHKLFHLIAEAPPQRLSELAHAYPAEVVAVSVFTALPAKSAKHWRESVASFRPIAEAYVGMRQGGVHPGPARAIARLMTLLTSQADVSPGVDPVGPARPLSSSEAGDVAALVAAHEAADSRPSGDGWPCGCEVCSHVVPCATNGNPPLTLTVGHLGETTLQYLRFCGWTCLTLWATGRGIATGDDAEHVQ